MGTRFDVRLEISAARGDVESRLIDPGFRRRFAQALHLGDPQVLGHGRGPDGRERLVVRHTLLADPPALVRAALGSRRLTWTEESALDRAAHQRCLRMVPDGLAERAHAVAVCWYSEDGAGTVEDVDGEVVVNYPGAGRLVVAGLKTFLRREAELLSGPVDG
jgi:hypothetical protein